MPSFYLASRISRVHDMAQVREELIDLGHTVTSHWIDLVLAGGAHANRDEMTIEQRRKIASSDLHDIRRADITILFAEITPNNSNGGRLVEFGYALGRNKECWVVGPLQNLFLTLKDVKRFPIWREAAAHVRQTWPIEPRGVRAADAAGDVGVVRGAGHSLLDDNAG